MWNAIKNQFNIKKHCAEYRVGLLQCPQFLFLVMGVIIIIAIEATYIVAQRFAEPEISALIVLTLTAFLFVIGHLIVGAFEQVARSARSKSEFIGIMSHQLRTPLSAIKWQLDVLLSEKLKKNIPTADESPIYLETIFDQNERMIQAVNDLLDVNRIEDRDIVLRPSRFSLADLSGQIIQQYQHYASAHHVRLILRRGPDTNHVFADEERIKSVIRRFLDNAIKYSPQGGEIVVDIERKGSMEEWRITDQGVGVSFVDQKRLFEKFFRSKNSVRYQTQGSGIGLFIAKAIITMSGGQIGFRSTAGRGSTFWFSLPIS